MDVTTKLVDRTSGCLGELARAKGHSVEFLRSLCVSETNYSGKPCVVIPYPDQSGSFGVGATRIRVPFVNDQGKADRRFRWGNRFRDFARDEHGRMFRDPKTGCTAIEERPILPYGLPFLAKSRAAGYLIMGEGESDGWACWANRVHFLGSPGADGYRCIKIEHVEGIPELRICREPGDGGKTFTEGLSRHLRQISYTGRILIFSLFESARIKDLADLHCHAVTESLDPRRPLGDDPAALTAARREIFAAAITKAMETAEVVPLELPECARTLRQCCGDRRSPDAAALDRVDLQKLICQDLGPADRYGKWRCPFHDDRHPSLSVHASEDGRERYRCWACGARGDAVDWLVRYRRMSNWAAWDDLVDGRGWNDIDLSQVEIIIDREPVSAVVSAATLADELLEIENSQDVCRNEVPEQITGSSREDKTAPRPSCNSPPKPPAFSVCTCRRPCPIAQEDRLNPSHIRVATAPCRSRTCDGCRPIWEARYRQHVEFLIGEHTAADRNLYTLDILHGDWDTARTAIKAASVAAGVVPAYVRFRQDDKTFCIISTVPISIKPRGSRITYASEELTADDASYWCDYLVRNCDSGPKPIVFSPSWRLPPDDHETETVHVPIGADEPSLLTEAGNPLTIELPRWKTICRIKHEPDEIDEILHGFGCKIQSRPFSRCDSPETKIVEWRLPPAMTATERKRLYDTLAGDPLAGVELPQIVTDGFPERPAFIDAFASSA